MMRRRLLLAAPLALAACHHDLSPQDVNIQGLVPELAFANCPDVCPATLYNLDRIFKQVGAPAADIVVLFVTVDPDRDSAPVLNQYTGLFGANVLGLRGNADELYALARRYRVVFSVTKTPVYSVTHSAAVYVFDAAGKPQFIIAGLDTAAPDIAGIAADLSEVAGG